MGQPKYETVNFFIALAIRCQGRTSFRRRAALVLQRYSSTPSHLRVGNDWCSEVAAKLHRGVRVRTDLAPGRKPIARSRDTRLRRRDGGWLPRRKLRTESRDLDGELGDLLLCDGLVGVVLLRNLLDEPGGQRRGHDAEQSNAGNHQSDRDAAAGTRRGRVIPVSDGRDGRDCPPQRVGKRLDVARRSGTLGTTIANLWRWTANQ